MNLAHLRYFQCLARVLHYSRAAEQLFITQPTLSHAMATLSEELGCELFRRERRMLALTPEGESYLIHVDRALVELDTGAEELKAQYGVLTGTVEVGAVASVRADFIPAALRVFRETVGDAVRFDLCQGFTATLNREFAEGHYDLLVAGPGAIPDTERILLFCQELAVAVRQDDSLAQHSFVTLQDLVGRKVATYRPGTSAGDLATRFLNDHDVVPGVMGLVRNCDDELSLGMQVIDEGVCALTIVNTNLPANGRLVIIPLREPGAQEFYPIYLVRRKGAPLHPAAEQFIEVLLSVDAPRYRHRPCSLCGQGESSCSRKTVSGETGASTTPFETLTH